MERPLVLVHAVTRWQRRLAPRRRPLACPRRGGAESASV